MQDSIARANDAAGEAVSGIRTVKSFNAKQSEKGRYDERLMDTHNIKTQRDTVRAVYLLVRRVSIQTLLQGHIPDEFVESKLNHNKHLNLYNFYATHIVFMKPQYISRLLYKLVSNGNMTIYFCDIILSSFPC